MSITIGIRREDKNDWERRAPLTPGDLAALRESRGCLFIVESSPIRVFQDEEYRAAGIRVVEDLSPASIIVGIKEVPRDRLTPGTRYACFAHVAKGQAHNMPMLRSMLELGCSLIDFEKIADEQNRRLIFFGRHAGCAGMVETLRCLGHRLAASGLDTPLSQVKHAFEYQDLEAAKGHLTDLGKRILQVGLPDELRPLVVGFSGYGNVSRGAQEMLACLRVREISPSDLSMEARARTDWGEILKVVFREEDMVAPADPAAPFDLQQYYRNPELYRSRFASNLDSLDVLVNAIYWEPKYPRLVSRDWIRAQYGSGKAPRLKVIGDISCDIEGSIEVTRRIATPDSPCFTYNPVTDDIEEGITMAGPVIMAVDNLPCEFPRESSRYFSSVLREMISDIASADWNADFASLNLPPHIKKAVIVHKGELTPSFLHLQPHLDAEGCRAG